MARWNRTAVLALSGLSFVLSLGLGCAKPSDLAEPGEVELVVEPGSMPYRLVGRFHLIGLDAAAMDGDVVFDGASSRQSVPLPAGRYMLTLHAGASVVCGDESLDVVGGLNDAEPPAAARLVSTSPQLIALEPGERVTAHIALGEAPQAYAMASGGAGSDPCAWAGDGALSRR
ncbi:MAG TPA: hypothetical protein VNN80_06615 [Polyangiaceae bacterium]|nr:hypothetical protein [Polyangiaceae bacterium]